MTKEMSESKEAKKSNRKKKKERQITLPKRKKKHSSQPILPHTPSITPHPSRPFHNHPIHPCSDIKAADVAEEGHRVGDRAEQSDLRRADAQPPPVPHEEAPARARACASALPPGPTSALQQLRRRRHEHRHRAQTRRRHQHEDRRRRPRRRRQVLHHHLLHPAGIRAEIRRAQRAQDQVREAHRRHAARRHAERPRLLVVADLLLRVSENRGEHVESEEGEVVAQGVRSDAQRLGEALETRAPEQRCGELRGEGDDSVAEHDGEREKENIITAT